MYASAFSEQASQSDLDGKKSLTGRQIRFPNLNSKLHYILQALSSNVHAAYDEVFLFGP
jgi:hypothetical protein